MNNLDSIIENGENQTVEFKKSLGERREALEDLCAMVNSDLMNGIVIFGVEDNGNICGLDDGNLDSAQISLSQVINDKFEPNLMIDIFVKELEGKKVLVLVGKRSRGVAYHEFDGRAWIKQGSDKRRLNLEAKKQLNNSRDRDSHNGPWRCDKCGTLVGMLFSMTISDTGMEKTYKCNCGGEYWPV